jgi:hypothetical protein
MSVWFARMRARLWVMMHVHVATKKIITSQKERRGGETANSQALRFTLLHLHSVRLPAAASEVVRAGQD